MPPTSHLGGLPAFGAPEAAGTGPAQDENLRLHPLLLRSRSQCCFKVIGYPAGNVRPKRFEGGADPGHFFFPSDSGQANADGVRHLISEPGLDLPEKGAQFCISQEKDIRGADRKLA
jgi:hypothetical protein